MRMQNKWMAFWRNSSGIALLEFAIALPILLTLFYGTVEGARYYLYREKLDSAATQILDIVNQNTNVNAASLDRLFGAFPDLMSPYDIDANDTRIIVTQIVRPMDPGPGQECAPVATWQYRQGGSRVAPEVGGAVNLGEIQMTSADNAMSIEIFTRYKPLIDNSLTRGIIGADEEYTVSYGHTRYGTFNFDPNNGRRVVTACGGQNPPPTQPPPPPPPQPPVVEPPDPEPPGNPGNPGGPGNPRNPREFERFDIQ